MDTVSTEHIAKDPSASTRRLEGVRARLLDAARDSYLFHTPPGGGSDHQEGRGPLLELKGPDLDRVYHHLLGQDDPLTFRPLHGGDAKGPAPSQTFGLAADLPRPHLSRSLAALHQASRARVRKAGTHQLALALGFLDWVEGDGEEEVVRRSPLVLVPVRLEASDESESEAGFRVRRAGSAAVRNELLAHVLRKDHWVELPAWRPAAGAAPVADFLDQIRGAIAGRTRWSVDSDAAVLACFDGEAFLHYLDLDPVSWRHGTAPSDHEIVGGLLGGLFYTGPAEELDPLDLEDSPFEASPFEGFSGPGVADHLLGNQPPGHVLDADGHQALGIEEVRQGLSLILTGRSGSGRTQTVANMVAGAARDGQRVLVVSGRPDDLDDLRGRLDEANLEPLTLGVYGMQASREAVLDAVAETLDQPDRKPAPAGHTVQRLRAVQQRLNAHAQQMHYPHSFAGISAYEIAGWMARLLTRGREPLDVPMEHVREWDKASLSNATDHLARLAKHVEAMGNPRVHPWRGVGGHGPEGGAGSSDEPCPEEVRGRVATFHEQLSHWERRVRRLAARLCVRARGIGDVSHMVSMAGRIVRAPDVDRKAIRSPVWRRRAGEIQALVRNGQRLEDVRDQVDPLLISAAWKEDLSQVRQVIKARGDSMLRWASPAYRQARARLKGLAQNQPPGSTTEQVRLLDTLDRGREALRQVESQDELGREAFGRHWRGADSEWAHLTSIIHWMAEATSPLSDNVPGALARTVDAKGLARLAADAEAGTEDIVAGFANLAAVLDVDLQEAFDCESLEQIPLATLKERLDDWARRPEGHQEWITYLAWEREARDLGLDPFADRLADGSLVPDEAVDVFHLTYLQELTRQLYSELPDLGGFDVQGHERRQIEFAELDTHLMRQNRHRVQAVHRAGFPLRSDAGEIGILLGQLRPTGEVAEDGDAGAEPLELKDLLRQAGRAVQAIKPVFLMAPGAVAEFLEPGLLNFDLVVVEAADSTPSDHALGAIVRGRQVVLVGSPSAEPGSILELCRARGMPERVLPVAYGRAMSPSVPSMEGGSREPSHDRTLEEVIAKSLTRSGYDVDYEVGAEGLGVDLAVRDPDDPNRYVLGILTDGAGYHAAASARERDRLIGEVLEGRGWNVHRAWALGWCRDPDAAWRRLLQAIERATALDPSIGPPDLDPVEEASGTWAAQIRALFESAGAPSEPWTPASPTGSADESVPPAPDVPSLEGPPYLEADFQVRLDCAPDQAPATELLSVVARIVDTEGPIHADEVTRRLARVWGIDQIGSRTQEAARWALQQAERDGEIQREGRFVWSSRGVNFRPRSRREVRSDTLRKANMIPPLEIRLALGQIVEGHVGVRPSEASELLTRVLGFERLGEELKDAFARQIQKMIEADELHLRDGKLYVA